MPQRRRIGFTLVELLVVITIIGMLMALLLPAVNGAMESARALRCKNRMRQIATALINYESRFESFPGYVNSIELQPGRERQTSWMLDIFGDMDRSNVMDQWKRKDLSDDDVPRPFIDVLTCPSDPPLDSVGGWTSYVANAGYAEQDLAGCGVFHSHSPLKYRDSRNRLKKLPHILSSLERVSSGDGTGTTMLITENIQASTWDATSFFVPGSLPPVKQGIPHNVFVWLDTTQPSSTLLIDGDKDAFGVNDRPTLQTARPSSYHRGGVNVAFCDGHIIFMRNSIDYDVYARLMSTDGEDCWKNYFKSKSSSPKIDQRVLVPDAAYR